jgi:hypothetical protein
LYGGKLFGCPTDSVTLFDSLAARFYANSVHTVFGKDFPLSVLRWAHKKYSSHRCVGEKIVDEMASWQASKAAAEAAADAQ